MDMFALNPPLSYFVQKVIVSIVKNEKNPDNHKENSTKNEEKVKKQRGKMRSDYLLELYKTTRFQQIKIN